jgi:Uma2 family endonuclease
MSLPAEKPRRATYADLEAVPPHKVAEILDGVLHVFPRPAPRHAHAASVLGMEIGFPFGRGKGGPGGWRILIEPELHFGPEDDMDVVVPDLAGWRLERMPVLPRTAYFTVAPDWICEVLSPSTETVDRAEKMPIYAREGVRHVWLVRPASRTLEVCRLVADGMYGLLATHARDAIVRAEPFQEVGFELGALWAEVEGGDDEEEEYRHAGKVLKFPTVTPKARSATPKGKSRPKPPRKAKPPKR